MKRIVSMLLCLVILLCSVAALADAPKVESQLPKDVYVNTPEPIFTIKYNGSNFDWRIERGNNGSPATVSKTSSKPVGENGCSEDVTVDWDYWYYGDYTAYDGGVPHRLVVTSEGVVTTVVNFFANYFANHSFDRISLTSWLESINGELREGVATYTHNNIRSFGPRFKDIAPELTKKWYRFTPVDLSQDGTQTFDMISGDHYVIGKVTVTVKGDAVKVTYKYNMDDIWDWKNYKFYTFFSDFDSVTEVEPEKITNRFEYGKEYSIEKDLKGDTDVLLYLGNKATHNDNEAKLTIFRETYKPYAKLCNEMLEMIGKTLVK